MYLRGIHLLQQSTILINTDWPIVAIYFTRGLPTAHSHDSYFKRTTVSGKPTISIDMDWCFEGCPPANIFASGAPPTVNAEQLSIVPINIDWPIDSIHFTWWLPTHSLVFFIKRTTVSENPTISIDIDRCFESCPLANIFA